MQAEMPARGLMVNVVLLMVFLVAFVAPSPIDTDIAGLATALFHGVAYALLTGYAVCRYPSSAVGAAFGVLAFSASVEAAQYFVPGRYFGSGDLLANAAGVGSGFLVAIAATGMRRAVGAWRREAQRSATAF
jgi:VanZ family protein